MNRFGVLGTNQELITDRENPDGYIKMYQNAPRPTIDHVCGEHGFWILPEWTIEQAQAKRKLRYELESDELMKHITADQLLGIDVTSKTAEWLAVVNKIKQEVPLTPPPEPETLPEPPIDGPVTLPIEPEALPELGLEVKLVE